MRPRHVIHAYCTHVATSPRPNVDLASGTNGVCGGRAIYFVCHPMNSNARYSLYVANLANFANAYAAFFRCNYPMNCFGCTRIPCTKRGQQRRKKNKREPTLSSRLDGSERVALVARSLVRCSVLHSMEARKKRMFKQFRRTREFQLTNFLVHRFLAALVSTPIEMMAK